ncbi:AAEL003197-PA [Aedes aegypti]|uniref:AAEL003197-PA n=1 Tax=Aedes aegypti TaxID=7159 RepID=Q17G35_AEDAE|nr:AAEL003197-PA [Aedes aegypti]
MKNESTACERRDNTKMCLSIGEGTPVTIFSFIFIFYNGLAFHMIGFNFFIKAHLEPHQRSTCYFHRPKSSVLIDGNF